MPRIFHKPLIVGPESIDAVGHVNNREYLRWMEDIAVEHSAAQGWPMERYFKDGKAWVYTWIATWDRRTSVRRYAMTRQRKLVARGETCWTFVELASGRACDLPDEVTEAFFVVPGDDQELKALGLARRERPRPAAPPAA
jgi:acyl-CoA thioester hydrolase